MKSKIITSEIERLRQERGVLGDLSLGAGILPWLKSPYRPFLSGRKETLKWKRLGQKGFGWALCWPYSWLPQRVPPYRVVLSVVTAVPTVNSGTS